MFHGKREIRKGGANFCRRADSDRELSSKKAAERRESRGSAGRRMVPVKISTTISAQRSRLACRTVGTDLGCLFPAVLHAKAAWQLPIGGVAATRVIASPILGGKRRYVSIGRAIGNQDVESAEANFLSAFVRSSHRGVDGWDGQLCDERMPRRSALCPQSRQPLLFHARVEER